MILTVSLVLGLYVSVFAGSSVFETVEEIEESEPVIEETDTEQSIKTLRGNSITEYRF